MVGEAVSCPRSGVGTAPLQEVQRAQEGLCEQEETLAFSPMLSLSPNAPRDSGVQMCPLDRVEK